MPSLPLPPVCSDASPVPPIPSDVRGRLAVRGCPAAPLPGEDAETRRDRLETGLLALFRDERRAEDFDALHAFTLARLVGCLARERRGAAVRLDPLELAQDVYVAIYRYAGSFRDERPRSFQVWVGAIARNLIRRRMRESRDPRRASMPVLEGGVLEPADLRPGPALALQSVEEQHSLRGTWLLFLAHYAEAYAALGERDRRALELVDLEERSYKECCELLSVRMSNMKMIMFRARKRIRARMMESMGVAEDEPNAAPRRLAS